MLFAAHDTLMDTCSSPALPDEGDTWTQESEEETLQSLLQVKARLWVPPSRLKVKLLGPFSATKGSFSQDEAIRTRLIKTMLFIALVILRDKLRYIILIFPVPHYPGTTQTKVWSHFRKSVRRLW